MLWARVIRGTSSSEKSVAPFSAASRQASGVESGSQRPMITSPGRMRSRSAHHESPQAPAVRIASTQSAANTASRDTISAPAAR